MVDIMEHLYQYIPSIKYEERKICSTGEVVMKEKANLRPILFGGDQLTAARARSAMKVRVNTNTSATKFSCIIPDMEDWHTKANFLGVSAP